MKHDTKDVSYCMRKGHGHSVPKAEMTKMLASNGNTWIRTCVTCKAETIERRKQKLNRKATQGKPRLKQAQ